MDSEIHIIIIWESAAYKEKEICEDVSQKFKIKNKFSTNWKQANIYENFSRFYQIPIPQAINKALHCGSGTFTVLIVEDLNPLYELRHTSKGVKLVNKNLFDAKEKFRSWTGGGHKIHASNNVDESRRDIALLFGIDIEQDLEKLENLRVFSEDLVGSNGYPSFERLFYILNATANYVILRNSEQIGLQDFSGNDIDLLLEDIEVAKYTLNLTKAFPEQHRVAFYNYVKGKKIEWDLRSPSDGYMSHLWCSEILINKELDEFGRFIPNLDNLFWSLIYHALIHKADVSDYYLDKISKISKKILNNSPIVLDNKANMLLELASFMALKKYDCPVPNDRSVFFSNNSSVLNKYISIFNKFFTLFKSTNLNCIFTPYQEIQLYESNLNLDLQHARYKLLFLSSIFNKFIYLQNMDHTIPSTPSIHFILNTLKNDKEFNSEFFSELLNAGEVVLSIESTLNMRQKFYKSVSSIELIEIKELFYFSSLDRVSIALSPLTVESSIIPQALSKKALDESIYINQFLTSKMKIEFADRISHGEVERFASGRIVQLSRTHQSFLKLESWYQSIHQRNLNYSVINRILFKGDFFIIESAPFLNKYFLKNISTGIYFALKSETLIKRENLLTDIVNLALINMDYLTLLNNVFHTLGYDTDYCCKVLTLAKPKTYSFESINFDQSVDISLGNLLLDNENLILIDDEFKTDNTSAINASRIRCIAISIKQLLNSTALSTFQFQEILTYFSGLISTNFTMQDVTDFILLDNSLNTNVLNILPTVATDLSTQMFTIDSGVPYINQALLLYSFNKMQEAETVLYNTFFMHQKFNLGQKSTPSILDIAITERDIAITERDIAITERDKVFDSKIWRFTYPYRWLKSRLSG